MAERCEAIMARKVFRVCDKCNVDLEYVIVSRQGGSTSYVHRCPHCGLTLWLDKKYPAIEPYAPAIGCKQ